MGKTQPVLNLGPVSLHFILFCLLKPQGLTGSLECLQQLSPRGSGCINILGHISPHFILYLLVHRKLKPFPPMGMGWIGTLDPFCVSTANSALLGWWHVRWMLIAVHDAIAVPHSAPC